MRPGKTVEKEHKQEAAESLVVAIEQKPLEQKVLEPVEKPVVVTKKDPEVGSKEKEAEKEQVQTLEPVAIVEKPVVVSEQVSPVPVVATELGPVVAIVEQDPVVVSSNEKGSEEEQVTETVGSVEESVVITEQNPVVSSTERKGRHRSKRPRRVRPGKTVEKEHKQEAAESPAVVTEQKPLEQGFVESTEETHSLVKDEEERVVQEKGTVQELNEQKQNFQLIEGEPEEGELKNGTKAVWEQREEEPTPSTKKPTKASLSSWLTKKNITTFSVALVGAALVALGWKYDDIKEWIFALCRRDGEGDGGAAGGDQVGAAEGGPDVDDDTMFLNGEEDGLGDGEGSEDETGSVVDHGEVAGEVDDEAESIVDAIDAAVARDLKVQLQPLVDR